MDFNFCWQCGPDFASFRTLFMIFAVSKGSFIPWFCRLAAVLLLGTNLQARDSDLPPIVVQGRVTVDGLAFDGTGRFKFALVRGPGDAQLWTHDGSTGAANFEPISSIQLPVLRGIYSVGLGDTTVQNMINPLNAAIFDQGDVRLRVWFNDGAHGFQQLSPDQRLGSVGYAYTSIKADTAAAFTGSVRIDQVPSILVTNNATGVNLTGAFTGDGSGLVGIRGSAPWQVASGATNDAFPNTGYLVTNDFETVIRLPANANLRVGDVVRVSGPNPGSWKITQQAGQSIFSGNFTGPIGANWVARETSRAWGAVATSRDGMNMVAALNPGLIYQSTNGGVNWSVLPASPNKLWRNIASSADGSRLIAAPQGGASGDLLYMSTDSGQNWSPRASAGSRFWVGVASSADGTNLVAVSFNGPLYISTDGGNVWTAPPTAGTRSWIRAAMSQDGSTMIAAVYRDKIYVSKNSGATWFPSNSELRPWAYVACSDDGSKIVASVDGGFIYTSSNTGTNWVIREGAGSRTWLGVACSSDASIIGAVVDGGKIYMSLDGGATWTPRESDRSWNTIACSADAKKWVAVAAGAPIFTSDAVSQLFTTTGPSGYLVGGEYSAIELQHVGNGRFMPLSSSGSIIAY